MVRLVHRGIQTLTIVLVVACVGAAASGNEGALPAVAQVAAISTAQSQQTASQVIEAMHETLIEVMKNADRLGYSGRFDLLAPVISSTFNIDFMGAKCLGRHWKQLSEAEKASWIQSFTRLTTANYAGRFTGYDGESFVTLGEEPGGRSTIVVLTKLEIPSDEDVVLNYRMIETDGQWRIIDVYLNGTVSELALRRSEYSGTLKRDGFEKLATAINAKIESLREKGGG